MEQLKLLGNVIEFPKNKEKEKIELDNKLYDAIKILGIIVEMGYDFNIVIPREVAVNIFGEKGKKIRDTLVISSSKEEYKKTFKNIENRNVFLLNGNIFDK